MCGHVIGITPLALRPWSPSHERSETYSVAVCRNGGAIYSISVMPNTAPSRARTSTQPCPRGSPAFPHSPADRFGNKYYENLNGEEEVPGAPCIPAARIRSCSSILCLYRSSPLGRLCSGSDPWSVALYCSLKWLMVLLWARTA